MIVDVQETHIATKTEGQETTKVIQLQVWDEQQDNFIRFQAINNSFLTELISQMILN